MFLSVARSQVLVVGQGADAKQSVAELRAALGGEEKLAAPSRRSPSRVRSARSSTGRHVVPSDFELAFELPDKYMKTEVFANLGGMQLKRRVGLQRRRGDSRKWTRLRRWAAAACTSCGCRRAARCRAARRRRSSWRSSARRLLTSSRREFARLTVGMIGSTFSPIPGRVRLRRPGRSAGRQGRHSRRARAPDGFTAKLFVDGKTHLPLMLTWMDKEPLRS